MSPAPLHTLAAPVRHEDAPVKGSRFVATAAPLAAPDELAALIEALRAEYPAATHHAWAWRLGPAGERSRSSDDGEPGGTAGRPILARLEGRGLTNAVVIVTRIFGGTKLGAGGLIRAYGGAAGMALDRATLVPLVVRARLALAMGYDVSGAVERLLASEKIEPVAAAYGDDVRLELEVPLDDRDALVDRLRDATRGRIAIEQR